MVELQSEVPSMARAYYDTTTVSMYGLRVGDLHPPGAIVGVLLLQHHAAPRPFSVTYTELRAQVGAGFDLGEQGGG